MISTFPAPPDWLPALVSRLYPLSDASDEALAVAALDAYEEIHGHFPSAFESCSDSSAAYEWLERAEELARLGSLPPLPSVYRDGVEVALKSVPPAVALLIGAEIAEGAGIGSLTIGGTVWAWD